MISHQVIGRNMRDARKKKGYTQLEASQKLGVSHLHYGRWERGDRPASLEMIAQVAVAFDTTVEALLSGAVTGQTVTLSPDIGAKQFGQAVAKLATGCSKRGRDLMFDLCKMISDWDRS